MAKPAPVSRRALNEGYEPEDVHVGAILIVAAASLILCLLIGLGLWGMVKLFAESHRLPLPAKLEQEQIEAPPPRLQPAPKDDLAAFHAQEEAALQRWAWVDRAAGVAQIPIDRAMALLAERGWPQLDRPADLVPPRAREPQAAAPGATPAGEERGPAAEPNKAPRMSPRETAPSQARPSGGLQ